MQSDGTASLAAGHPTAYKHDLAGYTKVLNFLMAYDQSHPLAPALSIPNAAAEVSGSKIPLPSPSLTPPPLSLLSPTAVIPSALPSSLSMTDSADVFVENNDFNFPANDATMADDGMSNFLNMVNSPPTAPVGSITVATATTAAARPGLPSTPKSTLPSPSTSSTQPFPSTSLSVVANDLLLYPCLSMAVTMLDSPLRTIQHARIMALSDFEREEEEDAAAFPSFELGQHQSKEAPAPLSQPPAPVPVVSPSKMTPTPAPLSQPSAPVPVVSPSLESPAASPADLKKAPVWLSQAYSSFSKLPYGSPWVSFLNQLVELERGYGFVSKVSLRSCYFFFTCR